jgi:hypothetical protein
MEMAMPDLDQIKQEKQGRGTGAGRSPWALRQSRRPTFALAHPPISVKRLRVIAASR